MTRQPANVDALRAAWRATRAQEVGHYVAPSRRVVDATAPTPRLYAYGLIGWDVDADEFVRAVHDIDAKAPVVDVHINSGGGFVYDAVAMHEALSSHPAPVTVHVDGLAASAASYLAMAGDVREIARGGRMMIHDAAAVAVGNADEFREFASHLDDVSDDIASLYAHRAGGKANVWRGRMKAETWYSADQAVSAGLADRIAGDGPATDSGPDNRTRLIRARARVALRGV